MGAQSSHFANSPENFPEIYEPVNGFSQSSVDLLNGLNCHSNPYVIVDSVSQRILYISAAFERIAKFESSAVMDKKVTELLRNATSVSPEIVTQIDFNMKKLTECFIPLICVDKRDESNVCLQINIIPLQSSNGSVSCILCSLQEMTNENECKQDPSFSLTHRIIKANGCMKASSNGITLFEPYTPLRELDRKFIDVLQEREEMFCITDPRMYDNPIVFASDNFISTIGYNRFEINGINCRFLQGFDTSPEDVDAIRDAIKDKKNARVCLLNYRKDGTRFVNQFDLSPLWSENGSLAYFIGVQMQVEDVDIMPLPNSRQTLEEMLLELEYEA